jgi:hypothetical protein
VRLFYAKSDQKLLNQNKIHEKRGLPKLTGFQSCPGLENPTLLIEFFNRIGQEQSLVG